MSRGKFQCIIDPHHDPVTSKFAYRPLEIKSSPGDSRVDVPSQSRHSSCDDGNAADNHALPRQFVERRRNRLQRLCQPAG
jgi:hypothetical protein